MVIAIGFVILDTQGRLGKEHYRKSFNQGTEKHQMQFSGIEELINHKYGVDKALLEGLHQAGVTVVLGTGSGTGTMGIVPGFSIHVELRMTEKRPRSAQFLAWFRLCKSSRASEMLRAGPLPCDPARCTTSARPRD